MPKAKRKMTSAAAAAMATTAEPITYPTVAAWAAAHGLARSTAYRLIREGNGPRLMRVGGRRVMVSREAAAEWRERMSDATPQPAA